MFEELDSLWRSPTIKPSFELVHVILALYIFEENKEGIGRYRIQRELSIGSGTAKSLIEKLNKSLNYITVLTDEKGHILTKNGLNFLKKIKEKIPAVEVGDPSVIKDIIIKSEGLSSFFCLVRNSSDKISNGIEQRDAAIKIGGDGATCLIYNGKDLVFPSHMLSVNQKEQLKINDNIFEYVRTLFNKSNSQLSENDVVLIGLAKKLEVARLAVLNAALTLL
jgi:hypothetical protein